MSSPSHFPCVIFALARESRPFLRTYPPRQRSHDAPCWAWWCGPIDPGVLVLQTGIGPRRMQSALAWLSAGKHVPFPPERIISAGFGGALGNGVRATDVVLADEVIDDRGRHWTTSSSSVFGVPDIVRGRLLTWPRLVGDPAEKRQLASTFGACAVDMESAVVAAFCANHDIPFLSLRAISDDAQTALSPRLLRLLSRERISAWRFLLAAMSAPQLLGECWRLARTTRRAAQRLAVALNALLVGVRRIQVPSASGSCLRDACRA